MSRRSCVAEYLPAVVLGTILGHLLDRVPPRSGLAVCELLAAAAWALMVTTGRAGTIVALALICGVTTGIFKIVSMAVVPHARRRRRAGCRQRRRSSTAQTLTNVAGVAIGGALVGLTSANVVLLLNAVTFAFSGAVLLAFSRVPRSAPPVARGAAERRRAWLAALARRGARRCLQTPMLRMILFSLPVASVALGIVIAADRPDAARHLRRVERADRRDHGARRASASRSARPCRARYAGYLGGHGAAGDRLGRLRHRARPLIAAPLSVIGGMGNGIVIVRFRTMMQRETPPHERASTIGFAYAVTFSMIVVGQIAVVPLANALGQRATFTIAGTIFALGGLRRGALLAAARSPRRRGSRPFPRLPRSTAR